MNPDSLDLHEVIEEFADLLETADIPYMLIGGYSVILRIPFRETFDGDFVVERADAENVQNFVKLLDVSDIFSVDEAAARDALSRGGKFSIFSERYGIHVFVWRRDISEFREKEEETGLYVAVPEFIIGEKLKLVKDSDTDPEDKKDVIALLTSDGVKLDDERLEEIAEAYGVSTLLEKYRRRASSAEPGDLSEVGDFAPPDSGTTRVEQVARMWKDGKSYKEMAEKLGISQSTVGVYVGRARERGLIPEDQRRK